MFEIFVTNLWSGLYTKNVNVHTNKDNKVLNDNISDHCDVVARILQQPTCTNALITNEGIEIDVVFEVLVEVIGETKMMVNVVNCNQQDDDLDMLENEINEDFLGSR